MNGERLGFKAITQRLISVAWVYLVSHVISAFIGHSPFHLSYKNIIIGLENLIGFTERYPMHAHRILSDSVSHRNWFSFAITSLNLTFDLYQLVIIVSSMNTSNTSIRLFVRSFVRFVVYRMDAMNE
jgi:hypothetical protein